MHVVWVPKIRAAEGHVARAATLIPDERTRHYWDGHSAVVAAYTRTMDFPADAWDIYMVYGPDARWEGDIPPKPTYWMHQLGAEKEPRVNGPYFEAELFTKKVTEILKNGA